MRTSIRLHWAALIFAFMGVAVLSFPAGAAEQPRYDEVNGYVWEASSPDSKLSFILGVENALAMEYALAEEVAKQQGDQPKISPFQEGWMLAFNKTPRVELVERVDTFYAVHPDAKNRHIFDVIWVEMILPVMQKEVK